jgi:hypothetical protein
MANDKWKMENDFVLTGRNFPLSVQVSGGGTGQLRISERYINVTFRHHKIR